MKKPILLSVLLFFVAAIAIAQADIPRNMQVFLKIPPADFCQPSFYYTLNPTSGLDASRYDILFRTYEMGYNIPDNKKKVSLTEQSLLVGFYGFGFSAISQLNILYGKPTDTSISPCFHNLLCDVLIKSQDPMEIEDLNRCNLVIVDLSKNKIMRDEIASVTTIPESCNGILYIFWNKAIHGELPKLFRSKDNVVMEVLNQVKVKRTNEIAQAKPKTNKSSVTKAGVAVAPVAIAPAVISSSVPAESAQTGGIKKNKDPVKSDIEKKSSLSGTQFKKSGIQVAKAPAISKLLYPEYWKIAYDHNHELRQENDTLLLSPKNDSLIASSKIANKILGVYPVNLLSIPVYFRSMMPGDGNDLELGSLVAANIKRAIFSYMGQKLFYTENKHSKTNGILQIPDFCNNIQELMVDWYLSADMKPESGLLKKTDTIIFYPKKSKIRMMMVDDRLNLPVNVSYVDIKKGNREILRTFKAHSGDSIPELYLSDSFYYLAFNYPGYKKNETCPVLRGDFESGKTQRLHNIPAFNIYYCIPDPGLKNKMITSLKEHLESVKKLKQQFLLFISNSDKPLTSADNEAANKLVSEIPLLFDQSPILKSDELSLTGKIKSMSIPKNMTINFNVLMSEKIYNSGGENFILNIYTTLKSIFPADILVYVYVNADLSERKFTDLKDQRMMITKQFFYHNLINE